VTELKKYGLDLNKKTYIEDIIQGNKPAFRKIMFKVKKWENKHGLKHAYELMNKPNNLSAVLLP